VLVDWHKSQNREYQPAAIEGVYHKYEEAVRVYAKCKELGETAPEGHGDYVPYLYMRCFDSPMEAYAYISKLPCYQGGTMYQHPWRLGVDAFFDTWRMHFESVRKGAIVPELLRTNMHRSTGFTESVIEQIQAQYLPHKHQAGVREQIRAGVKRRADMTWSPHFPGGEPKTRPVVPLRDYGDGVPLRGSDWEVRTGHWEVTGDGMGIVEEDTQTVTEAEDTPPADAENVPPAEARRGL